MRCILVKVLRETEPTGCVFLWEREINFKKLTQVTIMIQTLFY